MSEAIVVALITGVFAVLANWAVARSNRDKLYDKMDKNMVLSDAQIRAEIERHQAVTDTKLEELTREVREHNEFARRVPVLESQMHDAYQRIHDLEKKGA